MESILAPSFADIFYNNCFQNGILPVTLAPEEIQQLFVTVTEQDAMEITIDLPNQTVTHPDGFSFHFSIDSFRKNCLVQGLDAVGLTFQRESAITEYEQRRKSDAPWLFQDLLDYEK